MFFLLYLGLSSIINFTVIILKFCLHYLSNLELFIGTFEKDLIKLTENINFRKFKSHFHQSYKTSNSRVRFAWKMTSMYKLIKMKYKELLQNWIITRYKTPSRGVKKLIKKIDAEVLKVTGFINKRKKIKGGRIV